MAQVTKETVKAHIEAYIDGQGMQAGLEGLGAILKDILTLIPEE